MLDILPDRDRDKNWYLNQDVHHVLHNGDELVITAGYRFNGHSVPFPFHYLLPRYDEQDIIAALIHDGLIDSKPWHRYPRRFIDKEYATLMEQHSYGYRKALMPLTVTVWGYIRTFGWRDYRGDYEKHKTRLTVSVSVL